MSQKQRSVSCKIKRTWLQKSLDKIERFIPFSARFERFIPFLPALLFIPFLPALSDLFLF